MNNDKFKQAYLEIINQNNIINQEAENTFFKLFNLDAFQSASDSINSVDINAIAEVDTAQENKKFCKAAIDDYISAFPLFSKCYNKFETLGKNIGKVIKQKIENVLTKSKNGDEQMEGVSKKTAGGTKAGFKQGLKEVYDENVKSHTNRQLIVQNNEKVPKNLFKKTDKQIINELKLFVEQCAINGITPNQIFNINARRSKQKPIIFQDVVYTFKPTKTSLICQKKYVSSNKQIIFENNNLTNNTIIKTYQNNKLVFQQTATQPSNSQQPAQQPAQQSTTQQQTQQANNGGMDVTTVAAASAAGTVGGAMITKLGSAIVKGVSKTKGGFWKLIWKIMKGILKVIMVILITVLLFFAKIVLDLIVGVLKALGKTGAIASKIAQWSTNAVFQNIPETANKWATSTIGKGFAVFIALCILCGMAYMIYNIVVPKQNTPEQAPTKQEPPPEKTDPTVQLDPSNNGVDMKSGNEGHDDRADRFTV